MNRMPSITNLGSAVRSRLRFHDPDGAVDSNDAEMSSDRAIVPPGSPAPQRFELQEDPAFWKDHNVQVVIRIRPLSGTEISLQGYNKCVRQDSCQMVTWTGHPESRFTFDLVADEHVSQENLFKVAGVPMVENCVAGYNSCMFAYGQTGSGKTHTMLGDIEGGTRRNSVNCGMTPRVFEHMFTRIQKERENRREEKLRFTCKCSFLEIYNEQILDLLEPSSSNLQLREDAKKGIHVENLTEIEVSSARDVMQQLVQGAANRKVAATNMNRASSRSHSVFTCVIESKWESQGVNHHRFARLNLVDLAGSERQKSSGAEGDRLKEATNINKSLSTLGLVIMNLVGSSKKSQHVPYRDSKLTFLLQDSLGGNSKTTIIANISPSNCCALETLSTLKFAQRAKFIRNNAIVNEDASGDVLAMRLQIQQLKKEVSRLRGLVNGGAENPETGISSASFPPSPAPFKWDGGQGPFSPLTGDKRFSQRKEYEAALVAAFRRYQEKEAELKAMAAGKQNAEQLATQKEEEVRSLKMILKFREEGIKRLQVVASGKLSAESHLLQEKEELLKEMEILRGQIDRNPEVNRFARENLQLQEELRRLQSFVEEGEREMMNEQITLLQDKLLDALDWKLMHEKESETVKDLSLSWESSSNEENEFLRLQAIQNQREVEALRKNLTFCLETKEKLERRMDNLVSQLEEQRKLNTTTNEEMQHLQTSLPSASNSLSDNHADLQTMVEAIGAASQREAEAHETAIVLSKENEELRLKLKVLIEDNNRLIELYETAVTDGGAANQPQGCVPMESVEYEGNANEHLEQQLQDMHEENDKLMGLYETAMKERDELKRMLYEHNEAAKEERDRAEKLAETDHENLCLARTKLDLIRDKLATTEQAFKFFGSIEKAIIEADELAENLQAAERDVQWKQQEIVALQLALSELQRRKTEVDNKFASLRTTLNDFSSNANHWDESESRARAMVEAHSGSLEQKKTELKHLQIRKDEVDTTCAKTRQSETEMRNKIKQLKSKYQDAEALRKESERVLFAIDNNLNFGKASELLKSEEERTKISAEVRLLREQLVSTKKDVASAMKMSEALDAMIKSLEAAIESESSSLMEAETGLQRALEEKERLSMKREEVCDNVGTLVVEYQECVFESCLKEGEIELCSEELQLDVRSLEELRAKRSLAAQNLNQLMGESRCRLALSGIDGCPGYVSEKLDEELGDMQRYLVEAQSLLCLG